MRRLLKDGEVWRGIAVRSRPIKRLKTVRKWQARKLKNYEIIIHENTI